MFRHWPVPQSNNVVTRTTVRSHHRGCPPERTISRDEALSATAAHSGSFKHASAGPADRFPAAGSDRRTAGLAPADWAGDHEPAAPADRGPADRWGRAVGPSTLQFWSQANRHAI